MSDFGQKLRAARERRGVSLRDISERTKLSVATIEALERNDVSRLPGGIFARAFLRAYAAEVGLDQEATVREFIERFNVEPAPSSVVVDDGSAQARLTIIPTILKLVAISLVAAAIILYFTRIRRDEDSTATPTDARPTSRRVVSAVSQGAQLP